MIELTNRQRAEAIRTQLQRFGVPTGDLDQTDLINLEGAFDAAERRGGIAAMRLMVHHGHLHKLEQEIQYGTHYLQSQAQVPDQPLDSATVKLLDLREIS